MVILVIMEANLPPNSSGTINQDNCSMEMMAPEDKGSFSNESFSKMEGERITTRLNPKKEGYDSEPGN